MMIRNIMTGEREEASKVVRKVFSESDFKRFAKMVARNNTKELRETAYAMGIPSVTEMPLVCEIAKKLLLESNEYRDKDNA